ncbi:MAG: hypothetical protein RLZZ350_2450 [Verrucomicrobiota bacterium]
MHSTRTQFQPTATHIRIIGFLVIAYLAFTTAVRSEVLFIGGKIQRRSMDLSGRVYLNETSQCVVGIDTNATETVSRYIYWRNDNGHFWQQYWLGGHFQAGISATVLVDEKDIDKPLADIVSRPFKMATNYIVSDEIQPRMAGAETRVALFSTLNKTLVDDALNAGFIPIWGAEDLADASCSSKEIAFDQSGLLLVKTANFNFDVKSWREKLTKIGRKDAAVVAARHPDRFPFVELAVDFSKVAEGNGLPKMLNFKQYGQGAGGKPVLIQEIVWEINLIGWSNSLPLLPDKISPNCALNDFRSHSFSNLSLNFTYSSNTNFFELSTNSALFKGMAKEATFYYNNKLRKHFGVNPISREGQPVKPNKHAGVFRIIMLAISLISVSLIFYFGKKTTPQI